MSKPTPSASQPPDRPAIAAARRGYEKRLVELESQGRALKARDERLSTVRGITFLLAAGSAVLGLVEQSPAMGLFVAVAATVFMVFVVLHAIVSTRQFELERRLTLCKRALERLSGNYRAPADQLHLRGDDLVDAEHPYCSDLDIFGPSSLFEQLNTTQTPGGARVLAQWLRAPATPCEVQERQLAARELTQLSELREGMALAGMRAGKLDRDAKPFLEWAAKPADFAPKGSLLALGSLVLVAITLALAVAASLYGGMWTKVWLGAMALQVVSLLALRPRLEPVLAPVCIKQSPLGAYSELMALAEAQPFEDERLNRLRRRLTPGGRTTASAQLTRLDRLAGLAGVRHNALVHILADAFLMWDVWTAWLIDRWRADHGADVSTWLETLSELEALVALATFAHEHPHYAWPQVADDGPYFQAQALGHPLIPEQTRVSNDATLDQQTSALMITGSNMSGKSTMLRSIGINAVLAQAGAPVCATSLRLSTLRVFTSMRVGDALDQGASRFFMEVRKLKRVLDALHEDDGTLLFLLDEVLHGTNSRERNIGAKAVVAHLVAEGAVGAVSSHDLGLVELEELTAAKVRNVHFEDHLDDGAMCFDFLMKPGPVSSSNALRLMRMVGIDVAGLADG